MPNRCPVFEPAESSVATLVWLCPKYMYMCSLARVGSQKLLAGAGEAALAISVSPSGRMYGKDAS